MDEGIPYYPWAERLIEITLKTLIELNTEYSILPIGQEERIRGSKKVIGNDGFEILDEKVVCFKIIQNAMSSHLFLGSYQQEVKPNVVEGIRYWNFYRERKYHTETQDYYCDIVLDRVEFDGKDLTKYNEPVYIEAKRAKTKSTKDLSTGTTSITNGHNYKNCWPDIKKLIMEREYILEHKIYKKLFGNILIWGETTNPRTDNPTVCYNYLNDELKSSEYKNYKLVMHQVRWFPIDSIDTPELNDDYKIKKLGWVSLTEITPIY